MAEQRTQRERPLNKSILIVVPDPVVRALLTASFGQAGFFTLAPDNLASLQQLTREVRADVALFDIDAEQSLVSGTLAALACEAYRTVPRFMLTANCESPLVRVVDVPVECIRKPYSPRDAVAQVLLSLRPRQSSGGRSAGLARRRGTKLNRHGDLELDVDRQEIRMLGSEANAVAELAPSELRLLEILMKSGSRTLSREEIGQALWGDGSAVSGRAVDQCVKRLRETMAVIGAADALKTVRGFGYRLEALRWEDGSKASPARIADSRAAVDTSA